ncbi:MAG: hypothetical protein ACO3NL_09705 [Phycisphaerales bacterium]
MHLPIPIGLPRPAPRGRLAIATLATIAAALATIGCTTVGPAGLRSGRTAWSRAIADTGAEQTLLSIVRGRFGEPTAYLSVSAIASNWRLSVQPSVNAGFGPSSNYAGNLVPFGLTVVAEENPTVSYMPVSGARYSAQFLAPVDPVVAGRMVYAGLDPLTAALTFRLLVGEINEIHQPLLTLPEHEPRPSAVDDRFLEISTTFGRLVTQGGTSLVLLADEEPAILFRLEPRHRPGVERLFELLGLAPPSAAEKVAQMRISTIPRELRKDEIFLRCRSINELTRLAMACVEIPEAERAYALELAPAPGFEDILRIRSGTAAPSDAALVVQHRDFFYWIDDRDIRSKQFFQMIEQLQTLRQQDHEGGAPVLTLPVSSG